MKYKPVKAWGGFVDGKLHQQYDPDGKAVKGILPKDNLAVYSSRKRARLFYEDVRRIEIRVIGRSETKP